MAIVVALCSPSPLAQRNTRTLAVASKPRVPEPKPVFGLQREPRFAGKLEDIAGLYLSPPEHAVVWYGGENSQVQDVVRTRPAFANPESRDTTTVRHNGPLRSTPLAEALGDLCSSVIGSCELRERHSEWLKFLRAVNRQTSRNRQLHVICDNRATHDHPSVARWLAAHPRFHVHFALGSGSGLKMVKRFFNDVRGDQPGLGAFHTLVDLTAAVSRHLKVPLPDATPFTWVGKTQRSVAKGGKTVSIGSNPDLTLVARSAAHAA